MPDRLAIYDRDGKIVLSVVRDDESVICTIDVAADVAHKMGQDLFFRAAQILRRQAEAARRCGARKRSHTCTKPQGHEGDHSETVDGFTVGWPQEG